LKFSELDAGLALAMSLRYAYRKAGGSIGRKITHSGETSRDRLYDTAAGRYLTIADLRKWAARAISFVVFDAETGEDITPILLA
jgi:hypothetical protein